MTTNRPFQTVASNVRHVVRVLLVLSCPFVVPAQAQEPAKPNFEVKLLLDKQKVLDVRGTPRAEVTAALNLDRPKKMKMMFLDDQKKLHEEKWNVRLRIKEGDDAVEITYKKRFPIEKDSTIARTLADAAGKGFGADSKHWEPQVEVGYEKQTLSFSRPKTESLGDIGLQPMELPPLNQARRLAINLLPGKLASAKPNNWSKKAISQARRYGPVDGVRYKGKFDDHEMDFEIWTICSKNAFGREPVVEVSFKANNEMQATKRRAKLIEILNQNSRDWLIKADSLKTDMILENCN